jgi:hypothetical protein
MDGINATATSLLEPDAPGDPHYKVVAVADYDGDGNVDLVFDNGSQLAIWYLEGVRMKRGEYLPEYHTGSVWRVVGPK